MQCPKCKGRRTRHPRIASRYGCPHCDGAGEIGKDQWWECRVQDWPDTWVLLFNGGCFIGPEHTFDDEDVEPLYRMKGVN